MKHEGQSNANDPGENFLTRENTDWMQPNWVVLDIETTGVDAVSNGIVEIAAMKAGGEVFFESCRPRLGSVIEPDALRVNGHTIRGLESCTVQESLAVTRLLEWLGAGKHVFCGLNVGSFDAAFIDAAERVHGLGALHGDVRRMHRFIDLHTMACWVAMREGLHIPPEGFKADAISDLLGIPREAKPHHADGGVLWTAAAFQAVWDWANSPPEAGGRSDSEGSEVPGLTGWGGSAPIQGARLQGPKGGSQ